jgi:hypothetical protein
MRLIGAIGSFIHQRNGIWFPDLEGLFHSPEWIENLRCQRNLHLVDSLSNGLALVRRMTSKSDRLNSEIILGF